MIQFASDHLTVFESALYRTTTTVVHTEDLVLVVDPNCLESEIREIRAFVDRIRGLRPLYLLFTHSDYDHLLGFPMFADATTIASKALAQHPDPDHPLHEGEQFDAEHYLARTYDLVFPHIDLAIETPGTGPTVSGTQFHCYPLPGHNRDSILTILEPWGIWILGDYLSNEEFPFVYHSLDAYEESLDLIDALTRKHTAHIWVPGHGDVMWQRDELEKRLTRDRDYLRHIRNALAGEEVLHPMELLEPYRFRKGLWKEHLRNIDRFRE